MAIQGHLDEIALPALVQWVCQQGSQARLDIEQGDERALLYFTGGNLVHADFRSNDGAEDLSGEDVVYRILGWEDGSFILETEVVPPPQTIHTPWSSLLIEGLQRRDEERWDSDEIEQARRDSMPSKTTTDILKEFLDVPGISTAVVVGRDGFVIESTGGAGSLNLDALGASVAYAVNGIERMGQELQIRAFQDLFVEYGDAMIIARPVGDAVIALVAPDASQLGVIRYRVKPLVAELASYF